MVKIGCINIDTSHPGAFSEIFRSENRARYTAVYNDSFRGDDEVEGFMKTNGIEKRSTNLDEMAEQVDVAFIQGCNWDKHLNYVEPFIKRGKPVFVDKPLVGNMADVRKVREYVKNGATFLGCSCMRYVDAITEFLSKPVEERGEIVAVHSSCGVDEFNYAIHAVEAIGGLVGHGAVSCQFTGSGDVGKVHTENYTIVYENGITATYTITHGQWQRSVVTVMTTKATFVLDLASYKPMLDRVVESVETGVVKTAPVEDIIESILIMLAGKISRENGGKVVALKDIPEDYKGYDGDEFERGYAAAAKKMYAL